MFNQFPRYKHYQSRTILAIDYGTRRVGVATFCPGRDPYPLPAEKILYKDDEALIRDIGKLIGDEEVEILVLGLPKYLDGNSSEMTLRVEKFGASLRAAYSHLEFHYQDETLTSYEAEDRMKNSPRYNFKVNEEELDSLAASIILEDFIKAPLF